jgi:hypothetical protein
MLLVKYAILKNLGSHLEQITNGNEERYPSLAVVSVPEWMC